MKKTSLVWFAFLAFLLMGCRNDAFNPNDSNNQQAMKFRVIPASEIPQIMNVLQRKTNNFRVSIKKRSSATGKTETVFGDVVTSYIIETTTNSDNIYYTFPILPKSGDDSQAYNLVVRADKTEETQSAKIVIYEPAAEWLLNGNNDYRVFSGNVKTYSLDGNLESTVAYIAGTGNCPPPEPCPDCPTTPNGPNNPNPPGGPPGGGGPPSGPPSNPGGNDPQTPTPPTPPNPPDPGPPSGPDEGPPNNPDGDNPTPPNPNPPPPPNPGPTPGTELCDECGYVNEDTGECEVWIKVLCNTNFTANRIAAPTCGEEDGTGGGVVITTQEDICSKTKALVKNADIKPKLEQLYTKAKSTAGGELAFMVKNNGTPTDMIPGGEHNVNFDMTGSKGIYHNHTNKPGEEGIKMVSPKDIYALFKFISQQAAGTATNDAFVGMVGAQKCAVANDCSPDGYEMFNYLIRFSGTAQQAGTIKGMNYDFKNLSDDFRRREQTLGIKPGYGSQYGNYTSTKGLEELFFYILGKMGIEKSQMILQRIDKNGNINNVTLGTDGKPKDTACQ